MDANQLLVIDVQGSAGLVQADGSIKALSVGDVITVGDTVVTADNSTILIDVQGESLAIPANKSVTITPDLLAKETQDNSENTLFDDSIDEAIASLNQPNQPTPEQQTGTDISDFLDALEGGGDILDNLEATAAGGGGGAASGGGTSFVELARIAEGIDPSSLAFDDSFNADNTGIFSPRDTTDGVVPGDELIATLSVNELGLTNNPQPVISGTSENLVGQTVTVTVTDANGNTQVVTVVVQPDGTFVTPPLDPLPDGPITVDVVALDPNGDPVSDNIGASIDTVAPVVTIDTLTDSAIQNVLITGTVSGISSGDTVTITVTDSAGQVQVIATQVDDQGNWSITTEALAEGLYTVVASAVDEAGNEGSDSENGLVDLTAPVISIDTIGETNDTTPTISGTVSGVTVGSEITVVITGADNTVQTVTAIVAEDGSWIVDVPDALVEGEFTVTATAVDIAGNEAQATTTGVIDNTAPVISITPIDDTQDTTPNISGNVVGVQQGTLVTVVVTDINGQVQTLTTVTDADGNWSLDVVADLAEGIFDVSASVTDAAGNTAQADTQGVVDLTAPDITLTAIANTNDTTPTFVGRVEGVPEGTEVTIQVVDSNGQSQTLTALVLADGSYSVDAISPLPEGSFTAIATVSDAAGNSASANTTGTVAFSPISITIDSIADSNDTTPLLSGQTDGVATGTTISLTITASDGRVINLLAITQADGSWSIQLTEPLPEGDFTVVASVLDPQGNEAQATAIGNVDLTVSINFIIDTNDTTPSVSGSTQDVEPGAVVTVTFTGSDGATETLQVITDANGNWTVEASTALAEGQFTVTATVTDEVGNTATATEIGVIDLTDPTISINPLNDTNDTTPLISGSVADVPVGTTVTLVITDSNGVVQTITTTTNAQGVWQVETLNELAEGDYTVTASASDEAGNTSSATATGTIDLTAPIININAIADSNDTTPTISGTTQGLNAGSTVTVTVTDSNGSAQVFATVTNADGSWSINIDQELAEGEFTVVAQTQDEAGNSAQDIETGVIDLTAPTITIDEFNDSNDVTPIISGVVSGVDAGSVVTIILVDSNGNQQILTTTVNADSSWQVGANQVLAEGEFTITATVSDPAGNQAQDTTTGIIDLTAPIISLDNLGSSADNTPTISGTVQGVAAGTPVTLVVTDANGNSQTFTAITNDNGVFSADVPGSLADGQYTVTATVSDLAGNQASDSETGTVDSSSLTILIDALGETNDTTPSISGSTLNATAGDVVTVVIIPASGPSQTFTTTVDANGDWSINVSDELAEGEFTIDATVTDQFGNTANDSITAVVDTTAPLISIDTIGAINDSTPLISGSSQGATAGNTVTVTVVDSQNNSQTYTTTVDADGNWAVPVTSAVSQGEFTVTASITDNAGNTGTDTEVGTFDGINPLLTLDFDPLTNDSTPLITGTTDVTAGSIVTVNVTDSDGVVQTLSAVVAADGSWSISPNTHLAEGAFTVTASVEDESGNQTQITQNGVVDLTAPIITIDNLGTVNDTTPTISGQTNEPAGSIVTVVVSDGINSYEFSATVNADGSWSGDVPAELDDGNINVTASITDAAGNQAQATNSFILNSAAPSIAIDAINETNDTTPTISGTSDAPNGSVITIIVEDSNNNSQQLTATVQNGQWGVEIQQALSEGTFTVNASVTVDGLTSDAAAQGVIDVTAPTVSIDALVDSNDVTPIITGQTSGLAAGSVVTLTITDSAGAVQTASVVISQDGSWSAEVSNALAEGQYSVLAEVVDNAGNEASDSQLGIIDLSAPTISIDVIADTNDVTPTLTGQTTGVPQGTQVTLLITDSSGNTQTLTTTTLADGSWSVDAEVIIAEGSFTVEASVSDVAGNSASTSATGLIDLTPPTISVDPLSDSADVTPLISGVANGVATGTLVNLEITDSAGNVQTATAIVQADGSWSVEPSVAIAEGEFTVVATVQDTAGNQGSDTATGNIDTTAPSVFIDPQNITNDTTPVFSGQSSGVPAGTEVRLTVTDSAGNIQTLIAITSADGSWSVAATEVLAEGNYTIEAEVSDAAGNTGTDSATGEIDITAPTISLDTLADSNDVTPLISGQTTGAAVGSLVLLTITDSAGNVQSATATVQADGSWSVEPSTALAEGDYTVVATVSDAAGNEGSDTETGTIDVTAPTISIDAPALTNDNTPTVTGTSDLANTSLAVTFTDADGISHTVTVTTDASGNWSAEAGQALADGNYTVSASISDAAGKNTSASDSG
ncbi:Ig-like domain-containing protein, partial [Pseudoalteromonas sp. S1650]|uniref:Ig-like domain-containing protein n=1 Tax=Pseudoalteromonas sp. S1650 TaxID=579509 RepID=UPI00126BF7B7